MKIALWGIGNLLFEVIDQIDLERNSIIYLIDSSYEKRGKVRFGLPIRHYRDINDWNDVDAIVITCTNYHEIMETISRELPKLRSLVFSDVGHFLAYEYVNISHRQIAQNPLFEIIQKNNFELKTDKALQYLETYDRYFSKYRNTDVVFMEIGILNGDSLKIWKEYFGKTCKIIGIDIKPECEKYKTDQINIEIGSQESKYFWKYIKEKYSHIDIVLDDGGHTMKQQISTFVELLPKLAGRGIYMCEDVYTSYWSHFGGGWNKKSTFIEFTKQLVDYMNIRVAPQMYDSYWNNEYISNIGAVHYHPGIVVVEKSEVNICERLDNRWLR